MINSANQVLQEVRASASDRELQTVVVRHLGRRSYLPVWHAMQALTDARDQVTSDELWIVEHDPVFTLGQAGKWEHVLLPGDIPVIPVDRGGQVTYHGPGQIVAYPLYDLRRLKIGVRELVNRIEQAVIDTLSTWHINAERKVGAPGIYVSGNKVMALGLRVRRGCSFHGLALNVKMDLSPYRGINPCGFRGLEVTQIADLGGPGDINVVTEVLIQKLAQQFSQRIETSYLPHPQFDPYFQAKA